MSSSIIASSPKLAVVHGQAFVSSLQVAEHFEKLHYNVLRDIEALIAELPAEFNRLNFEAVEYTDAKGERRPAYNLSRDAFTLLAMGFTGPKALAFKLAYITAFNRMEAELLDRNVKQLTSLPGAASMLRRIAASMKAAGFSKRQIFIRSLKMVKEATGIDFAPPPVDLFSAEPLVRRIALMTLEAKRYAGDTEYSTVLAAGIMPHSKLLKLSHVSAKELAEPLELALMSGAIRKVDASEYGYFGVAYVAGDDMEPFRIEWKPAPLEAAK